MALNYKKKSTAIINIIDFHVENVLNDASYDSGKVIIDSIQVHKWHDIEHRTRTNPHN